LAIERLGLRQPASPVALEGKFEGLWDRHAKG
jgi:hypothetical protein